MSNTSDFDRFAFIVIDGNLQRYQGNDVDVVIPDCVTKVSKSAFKNAFNVRSITVPGTVRNLGIDTFSQVYALKELILSPGSQKFTTINGALCSADGKKLLMVPRGREAYEIPECVTAIGNEAFCGCNKIKRITFPATVAVIGERILGYSTPMHIVICNHEAVIHENAFETNTLENCFLFGTLEAPPSLMKAVISSVKRKKKSYSEKIIRADDTVAMERFLSLWKNMKVEELEGYIKMSEAAQSLGVLDILKRMHSAQRGAKDPCKSVDGTDEKDSLQGWRKILKLSVSNGSITVTGYKGADVTVVIPEEIEGQKVVDIKSRAFAVCEHIQIVRIRASVPTIRAGVFSACSSLETVVLPEGITAIGKDAFWNCLRLRSIPLPQSLTAIEDSAFRCCKALESMTIPDSVKIIGKGAFSGCSSLKSITLTDGIEMISSFAFELCSSLEELIIPPNVTQIGFYAFSGCSSLKKVLIPESVSHIAYDAFINCRDLTIYAPAGSYAETYAKERNIPFVAE